MVCAENVIAFQDRPPWGSGHPQWLDKGLGLLEDMSFFPHARRRLALEDAPRQARLARRVAPARAVLLDDGAILSWRAGHGWAAGAGVLALGPDGALTTLADELPHDPARARVEPR
jgi:hypothetical protein